MANSRTQYIMVRGLMMLHEVKARTDRALWRKMGLSKYNRHRL